MVDMCEDRKKAKGEVRAQSLFDVLLTNDIYLICAPPFPWLTKTFSYLHILLNDHHL